MNYLFLISFIRYPLINTSHFFLKSYSLLISFNFHFKAITRDIFHISYIFLSFVSFSLFRLMYSVSPFPSAFFFFFFLHHFRLKILMNIHLLFSFSPALLDPFFRFNLFPTFFNQIAGAMDGVGYVGVEG